MKIYGTRPDGSVLVSLGGGVGVIMRGQHATRAHDLEVLHKMGPWAKADNGPAARRGALAQLNRCRVVGITQFRLGS